MRPKSSKPKASAERVVKDIRRATRKQYSAEEKTRIVLEGLRGEASSLASCPRHDAYRGHRRAMPPRGSHDIWPQGVYYKWLKDFMEAGKRRLAGDTARAANTDEVRDLRRESRDLKEVVADLTLENRLLKNVWPAPSARGNFKWL